MSDSAVLEQIDDILSKWRQGDCVLGEHWFLFRLDISAPLTPEAAEAAEQDADAAEAEVRGFMVATQTCDIARTCSKRPFVEVCPLVEVDPDKMKKIRRGSRPNYAFIPGLADKDLVADLDRVMTVEKAVCAGWERIEGCLGDNDVRILSLALARKRTRVAFPDDFVEFASNLAKRMSSKHNKASEEGCALRALREIRVRAAPSWDASKIEVFFWFIRDEADISFENKQWNSWLDAWLKLLPSSERFTSIDGVVVTLDDLTARDYIESAPLDLDHLSSRTVPLEG